MMKHIMAVFFGLLAVALIACTSVASAQESGESSVTQGTGDTNLVNPGDCCLNHLATQNGAPTKSPAAKLKQVDSYSGGEKTGRPGSGTSGTGVREDAND